MGTQTVPLMGDRPGERPYGKSQTVPLAGSGTVPMAGSGTVPLVDNGTVALGGEPGGIWDFEQDTLEFVHGEDGQTTTYVIDTRDPLGSGGYGVVLRAQGRDGEGRGLGLFAAKMTPLYDNAVYEDEFRKVHETVHRLTADPTFGGYKVTHLMPILAYGRLTADLRGGESRRFDVVVMPICEQLDEKGQTGDTLRGQVLPAAARALNTLHENRIVHRDVKPSNLFVCKDENDPVGTVVLGDFNISTTLDASESARNTRTMRGTPGYCSRYGAIMPQEDWYALGYALWTLYNGGVHPHQRQIDAGTLTGIMTLGERPVPFEPHKDGDEELGKLIYGLTYYEPTMRLGYEGVKEFLGNPRGFSWEDPKRADRGWEYKFKDVVYRNGGDLARALAADWGRACEHVFQGTLRERFIQQGETDLATAINQIVESREAASNEDLAVAKVVYVVSGDDHVTSWKGYDVSYEALITQIARHAESGFPYWDELFASGFCSWAASGAGFEGCDQVAEALRCMEQLANNGYRDFAFEVARHVFRLDPQVQYADCETVDQLIDRAIAVPRGFYRCVESRQVYESLVAACARFADGDTILAVRRAYDGGTGPIVPGGAEKASAAWKDNATAGKPMPSSLESELDTLMKGSEARWGKAAEEVVIGQGEPAGYASVAGVSDIDAGSTEIEQSGEVDRRLILAEQLLVLFDGLAQEQATKNAVRRFYCEYGPAAPWIWLSEHAGLYVEQRNGKMHPAAGTLESYRISDADSMESMVKKAYELRVEGKRLAGDMDDSPLPCMCGVHTSKPVVALEDDAFFCSLFYGERAPRGFVRHLLRAKGSGSVGDWSDVHIVGGFARRDVSAEEEFREKTSELASRLESHASLLGAQLAGAVMLVILMLLWMAFGVPQAIQFLEGRLSNFGSNAHVFFVIISSVSLLVASVFFVTYNCSYKMFDAKLLKLGSSIRALAKGYSEQARQFWTGDSPYYARLINLKGSSSCGGEGLSDQLDRFSGEIDNANPRTESGYLAVWWGSLLLPCFLVSFISTVVATSLIFEDDAGEVISPTLNFFIAVVITIVTLVVMSHVPSIGESRGVGWWLANLAVPIVEVTALGVLVFVIMAAVAIIAVILGIIAVVIIASFFSN